MVSCDALHSTQRSSSASMTHGSSSGAISFMMATAMATCTVVYVTVCVVAKQGVYAGVCWLCIFCRLWTACVRFWPGPPQQRQPSQPLSNQRVLQLHHQKSTHTRAYTRVLTCRHSLYGGSIQHLQALFLCSSRKRARLQLLTKSAAKQTALQRFPALLGEMPSAT